MQTQNKSQKARKIISGITLFCFLATESGWAVPGAGISLAPQHETPAFLQIEIPPDLASVEEVYEAPAKADPKLVLHIQNIHGSYESQLQIKKLLDYLYQKYGFKLLFAEGAASTLNPDLLRFFPDAESNEALADSMAKDGQLTGIEYYLVNGPKDVEAIGIEETALYRQNYDAFKKVYGAKREVDQYLDRYEGELEMLASRTFPQNTRRLISEWRKFENGHRDFLPYVKRLGVDAKSVLGVDLESIFSQVEWPQMTRLLALQSMEKELDKAGAEKEKNRLLDFLKTHSASEELTHAIEKLTEQRITMERLTEEKKLEDLPRYLLERLVTEMGPKGFRFHEYPAFSLWAGYLILQNELDSRLLFEEIEKIFTKILDEMSVTEREKNLLELYRDAILIRKLMHLELTRKEWDRVLYRKEWMTLPVMESRLQKIAAEMQGNQITGAEIDGDKALGKILDTSYDFYGFARKRESAFLQTIQREMETRKVEKAVLVTGGFHTDGLMEIFREKEINCGVLMPRLNGVVDNSSYVSSMLENSSSVLKFKIQNIELISWMLGAEYQEVMGRSRENMIGVPVTYMLKVKNEAVTPAKVEAAVKAVAAVYKIPVAKVTHENGVYYIQLAGAPAEERTAIPVPSRNEVRYDVDKLREARKSLREYKASFDKFAGTSMEDDLRMSRVRLDDAMGEIARHGEPTPERLRKALESLRMFRKFHANETRANRYGFSRAEYERLIKIHRQIAQLDPQIFIEDTLLALKNPKYIASPKQGDELKNVPSLIDEREATPLEPAYAAIKAGNYKDAFKIMAGVAADNFEGVQGYRQYNNHPTNYDFRDLMVRLESLVPGLSPLAASWKPFLDKVAYVFLSDWFSVQSMMQPLDGFASAAAEGDAAIGNLKTIIMRHPEFSRHPSQEVERAIDAFVNFFRAETREAETASMPQFNVRAESHYAQDFLNQIVNPVSGQSNGDVVISESKTPDGDDILIMEHVAPYEEFRVRFRYEIIFHQGGKIRTQRIPRYTKEADAPRPNRIIVPVQEGKNWSAHMIRQLQRAWRRTTIADPVLNRRHIKKGELELADYQEKAVAQLRHQLDTEQKALGVMATATGKTVVAFTLADQILQASKALTAEGEDVGAVLFLVNNKQILEDAEKSLHKMTNNRFKSSHIFKGEADYSGDVIFATPASLNPQRLQQLLQQRKIKLVIVDEVHHLPAESNRLIFRSIEEASLNNNWRTGFLGLTATETRPDRASVIAFFGHKIDAEYGIKEGWRDGYLVQWRYHSGDHNIFPKNHVGPLEPSHPAYAEYRARMYHKSRYKALLKQYQRQAKKQLVPKGLILAHKVSKAKALADYFQRNGVRAVALTGKDRIADPVRFDHTYQAWKTGRWPEGSPYGKGREHVPEVVIGVRIFQEGVDVPNINVLMLWSDTNSTIKFIQQIGRGLRIAEFKTHIDIIDSVGLFRKLKLLRYLGSLAPARKRGPRTAAAADDGDDQEAMEAPLPPGLSANVSRVVLDYFADVPGHLSYRYGTYPNVPVNELPKLDAWMARRARFTSVKAPEPVDGVEPTREAMEASLYGYLRLFIQDYLLVPDALTHGAADEFRKKLAWVFDQVRPMEEQAQLFFDADGETFMVFYRLAALFTQINPAVGEAELLKLYPEMDKAARKKLETVARNLRAVRQIFFKMSVNEVRRHVYSLLPPSTGVKRTGEKISFDAWHQWTDDHTELQRGGSSYLLEKAEGSESIDEIGFTSSSKYASRYSSWLQKAVIEGYLLDEKLRKFLQPGDFERTEKDFLQHLRHSFLLEDERAVTMFGREFKKVMTVYLQGALAVNVEPSVRERLKEMMESNLFNLYINSDLLRTNDLAGWFKDLRGLQERGALMPPDIEIYEVFERIAMEHGIFYRTDIPGLTGLQIEAYNYSDDQNAIYLKSNRSEHGEEVYRLPPLTFTLSKDGDLLLSEGSAVEKVYGTLDARGRSIIIEEIMRYLNTFYQRNLRREDVSRFVIVLPENLTMFYQDLHQHILNETDWDIFSRAALKIQDSSQVSQWRLNFLTARPPSSVRHSFSTNRIDSIFGSYWEFYLFWHLYRPKAEELLPRLQQFMQTTALNESDLLAKALPLMQEELQRIVTARVGTINFGLSTRTAFTVIEILGLNQADRVPTDFEKHLAQFYLMVQQGEPRYNRPLIHDLDKEFVARIDRSSISNLIDDFLNLRLEAERVGKDLPQNVFRAMEEFMKNVEEIQNSGMLTRRIRVDAAVVQQDFIEPTRKKLQKGQPLMEDLEVQKEAATQASWASKKRPLFETTGGKYPKAEMLVVSIQKGPTEHVHTNPLCELIDRAADHPVMKPIGDTGKNAAICPICAAEAGMEAKRQSLLDLEEETVAAAIDEHGLGEENPYHPHFLATGELDQIEEFLRQRNEVRERPDAARVEKKFKLPAELNSFVAYTSDLRGTGDVVVTLRGNGSRASYLWVNFDGGFLVGNPGSDPSWDRAKRVYAALNEYTEAIVKHVPRAESREEMSREALDALDGLHIESGQLKFVLDNVRAALRGNDVERALAGIKSIQAAVPRLLQDGTAIPQSDHDKLDRARQILESAARAENRPIDFDQIIHDAIPQLLSDVLTAIGIPRDEFLPAGRILNLSGVNRPRLGFQDFVDMLERFVKENRDINYFSQEWNRVFAEIESVIERDPQRSLLSILRVPEGGKAPIDNIQDPYGVRGIILEILIEGAMPAPGSENWGATFQEGMMAIPQAYFDYARLFQGVSREGGIENVIATILDWVAAGISPERITALTKEFWPMLRDENITYALTLASAASSLLSLNNVFAVAENDDVRLEALKQLFEGVKPSLARIEEGDDQRIIVNSGYDLFSVIAASEYSRPVLAAAQSYQIEIGRAVQAQGRSLPLAFNSTLSSRPEIRNIFTAKFWKGKEKAPDKPEPEKVMPEQIREFLRQEFNYLNGVLPGQGFAYRQENDLEFGTTKEGKLQSRNVPYDVLSRGEDVRVQARRNAETGSITFQYSYRYDSALEHIGITFRPPSEDYSSTAILEVSSQDYYRKGIFYFEGAFPLLEVEAVSGAILLYVTPEFSQSFSNEGFVKYINASQLPFALLTSEHTHLDGTGERPIVFQRDKEISVFKISKDHRTLYRQDQAEPVTNGATYKDWKKTTYMRGPVLEGRLRLTMNPKTAVWDATVRGNPDPETVLKINGQRLEFDVAPVPIKLRGPKREVILMAEVSAVNVQPEIPEPKRLTAPASVPVLADTSGMAVLNVGSVISFAKERFRLEENASGGLYLRPVEAGKKNIPLADGVYNLGRETDNQIQLTHETVSRHQAVLTVRGKQVFVEDISSKGTTAIDGMRIRSENRPPDDRGPLVSRRSFLAAVGFGVVGSAVGYDYLRVENLINEYGLNRPSDYVYAMDENDTWWWMRQFLSEEKLRQKFLAHQFVREFAENNKIRVASADGVIRSGDLGYWAGKVEGLMQEGKNPEQINTYLKDNLRNRSESRPEPVTLDPETGFVTIQPSIVITDKGWVVNRLLQSPNRAETRSVGAITRAFQGQRPSAIRAILSELERNPSPNADVRRNVFELIPLLTTQVSQPDEETLALDFSYTAGLSVYRQFAGMEGRLSEKDWSRFAVPATAGGLFSSRVTRRAISTFAGLFASAEAAEISTSNLDFSGLNGSILTPSDVEGNVLIQMVLPEGYQAAQLSRTMESLMVMLAAVYPKSKVVLAIADPGVRRGRVLDKVEAETRLGIADSALRKQIGNRLTIHMGRTLDVQGAQRILVKNADVRNMMDVPNFVQLTIGADAVNVGDLAAMSVRNDPKINLAMVLGGRFEKADTLIVGAMAASLKTAVGLRQQISDLIELNRRGFYQFDNDRVSGVLAKLTEALASLKTQISA